MGRSHALRRRGGWFALPRVAGLTLLVSAFVVGQGRAQYQMDQSGRLFDANPQLGGSRYNPYVRPVSPLVGGNPFATGNVGRGLSLRSFSPISAPGALRVPLGTTSLSNFIRDSVSVGDQAAPLGGLTPRAFFDPARTAPTGSYLRGFYDFQPTYPTQLPTGSGTGAAATTTPFDGMLQYGSPPTWRAGLERVTRAPYEPVGAPLNTELSSTIFGLQPPALPGPLSDAALQPRSAYLPEIKPDELGSGGAQVSVGGLQEPLDLRAWPTLPVEPGPTPLDVLMQEDASRLLTERPLATLPPTEEISVAPELDRRSAETVLADRTLREPTPLDPTTLLGNDVFTDMRLALELALNPQAEWLTEMRGAAPEGAPETPALAMEMQARAAATAEEFLTRVLEMPLHTFVGDSASAVNDELRKAETAMGLNRYYDAVRCYERVRQLDPANPLALIGKGHALLAAGEYVSAAVSLIRGLEHFPEMTRFHVDLMALMGGEIADIRRADLMKQLAHHEDPQLRFLLGYIEVHTGQRDLGLQNLDRAAREAKPGSLIHRYPDMIRRQDTMPASKLFPDESPGSVTNGSRSPGGNQSSPGKEPE